MMRGQLFGWHHLLISVVGGIALALLWVSGIPDYFTVESLRTHYSGLAQAVGLHPMMAALVYVSIFVVISVLAVPVALYLAIAGGVLFGFWWGLALTLVGKCLAAAVMYGLVELFGGRRMMRIFERHEAGRIGRIKRMFTGNMFSVLLVMRIVPMFPFFLVSLIPAVMGMRFGPYMLATLVGLIPGNVIYCLTGIGLVKLLAAGGPVTLEQVLTPEMWAGLFGLALMSLLPKVIGLGRYRS